LSNSQTSERTTRARFSPLQYGLRLRDKFIYTIEALSYSGKLNSFFNTTE
jgi:hypothetical protein